MATWADVLALGPSAAWLPYDSTKRFKDIAGTVPATADGDGIAYLTDASGNGHHAITDTLAHSFVLKTAQSAFGGIDIARSTGVNEILQASALVPKQWFGLLVSPGATWSGYGCLLAGLNGTSGRIGLFDGSASYFYSSTIPFSARKNGVVLPSPFDMAPITTPFVLTVCPSHTANVSQGIVLLNGDGSAHPLAADFAACIAFDHILKYSERAIVESFLAGLGGIGGVPGPPAQGTLILSSRADKEAYQSAAYADASTAVNAQYAAANGSVVLWRDTSGYDHDLNRTDATEGRAVPGAAPLLKLSIQNGLPMVLFGGGAALAADVIAPLLSGNQPCTIAFVIENVSISGQSDNYPFFYLCDGVTGTPTMDLFISSSTGFYEADRRDDAGVILHESAGTPDIGVPHILILRWDGTNLSVYLDGTLLFTGVPGTGAMTCALYTLGVRRRTAGDPVTYVNSYIGEHRVYTEARDVTALTLEMASAWGFSKRIMASGRTLASGRSLASGRALAAGRVTI